jgi:spoIIIJ-associated protein
MEAIELSAANLDEATAQAAAQLGVSPSDVKVTVLEETKGLFGRPGKVRIKAELSAKKKPAAKAPKAEKPAKEVKEVKAEPVAEAPAQVEEAPVAEEKPARGGRGRKPKAEAAGEESTDAPAGEALPEAQASQEDADRMVAYVAELMELGHLDVEVKCASFNGRYVNLELDGQDVGFLVGRRGEVLNALQYVCNVIAARQLHNGVRITVEGNSYRQRREDALTTLAQDIAEQVRERGEEAVLDALPAFERRIVHQALVDFAGVVTYSEGEEPNRRVVIAPAD